MQSKIFFLLLIACAKGSENTVETTIEEYPYMAALRFDNVSMCASVIISQNSLLTTAHCIYNMRTFSNKEPSPYFISVGETKQNPNAQRYKIDKWVTHDNYKNPQTGYDIGIIWIKGAFTLSPKIQVADLDSGKVQFKHGDNARMVDWCMQNDQHCSNPTLLIASVKILGNKECQALLQNKTKIQESMMCTSDNNACENNSSGPLLIGNTVVGLVSYGGICGKSLDHPEVYTKLSSYAKWIRERIKEAK